MPLDTGTVRESKPKEVLPAECLGNTVEFLERKRLSFILLIKVRRRHADSPSQFSLRNTFISDSHVDFLRYCHNKGII